MKEASKILMPADLKGFTQCHFFAGIGGWSYALRLAGWPDDRPAWTGSPPCTPFSTAGKQLGVKDERHLAPYFIELVQAVRPPVLFGEQVASAIKKDAWLDDLLDALEDTGYATGAAVAPACSVGAPHLRQRLWFVAKRVGDSNNKGSQGRALSAECADQQLIMARSVAGGMADTESERWNRSKNTTKQAGRRSVEDCGGMGQPDSTGFKQGRETTATSRYGNTVDSAGWSDYRWIECADGKLRPIPVEPSLFPLSHGLPGRVGLLRGAGNAIVPQVAAEIVMAAMPFLNNQH